MSGRVEPRRAPALAAMVISACEGAVAVVRAERDMAAFELVAAQLTEMVVTGE